MKTFKEVLKNHNACEEAIKWFEDNEIKSIQQAWDKCKYPDWILWVDDVFNFFSDKDRRLMACRFVRETPISDGRTVWDLLDDNRSRNAVVVAEKYSIEEATKEDLEVAWNAAWNATDDRDVVWTASDAAWFAIRADARSSARACVRAVARNNSYDEARSTQCDIIRSYTPDWSKFEEEMETQ